MKEYKRILDALLQAEFDMSVLFKRQINDNEDTSCGYFNTFMDYIYLHNLYIRWSLVNIERWLTGRQKACIFKDEKQ